MRNRLVLSRTKASGLPPRTLHGGLTTAAGVRETRPQGRRYYLSQKVLLLPKTKDFVPAALFYKDNYDGLRRLRCLFPLSHPPYVFAAVARNAHLAHTLQYAGTAYRP